MFDWTGWAKVEAFRQSHSHGDNLPETSGLGELGRGGQGAEPAGRVSLGARNALHGQPCTGTCLVVGELDGWTSKRRMH